MNNGSGIQVVEENNYYPFGLKHSGYNGLSGNPSYQYKYNGKELQQETGMYDYGAMFYMPDIGRWGVVDNKAEKYSSFSSYAYTINNPVKYLDPDGNDILPSKDFLASRYGAAYKNLRKSNSNYNSILSKYNNTKNNNYYLFLGDGYVPVGANAVTTRTKKNITTKVQGNKIIEQITRGYEVESYYSRSNMNDSNNNERSEISLIRTIIHEGIHAKLALSPEINDDDKHNKYSEYQKDVYNALTEYNKDNKLGYSDEDIEAISWGGAFDSDAFKSYINNLAKKNGTTYDEEYRKWDKTIDRVEYNKVENETK